MTAEVRERAPDRRVRAVALDASLAVGGSLLAAALSLAAGGAGILAVAGTAVLIVTGAAAWHWRALLQPLLPGQLTPSPTRGTPTDHAPPVASRRRPLTDLCLVGVAAVAAAGAAVVAGMLGMKGIALVVMALGGFGVVVLWRRELLVIAFGDRRRDAPEWLRRRRIALPVSLVRSPELPRWVTLLGGLVFVGGGVAAAWMAASLGIKGAALLVGCIGLATMLLLVRDREDLMLFVMVCSLVLFLHKSIGPLHLVNSGAPAVYITSLGLILVILYALWGASGSFATQAAAALRRPIVLVPLAGALLMLPSLLVARKLPLAVAELVRMGWMYLLFFYIAVRVRRAAQIWLILAGLGVVSLVEFVVVALQFKTGGVLGLGFLGVPTELGERITDGGVLGRPFGTIVHPVFLGAVMASLGLLALSVGLALREVRQKALVLGFVPVCAVTLALSQARVALVGFVGVAGLVVVASTLQGRLSRRSFARIAAAATVGALLMSPYLWSQYESHFKSDHVSVEVQSRVELNDVAYEMIADHPVLGVGLNHFQDAMGPYDRYGLLFEGNPVHNLYLLQASETGYVGLAGLLLVGAAFLRLSLRLSRSTDPLLGGLGTGITAVTVFFALEELAGFSLRQEIPLALWWLLAGLAVAGSAMAREDRRPAHLASRADRPTQRPIRPRHVPSGGRPRRERAQRPSRRRRSGLAGFLGLAVVVPAVAFGMSRAAGADEAFHDVRIVFAAYDRVAGGEQALFTASGDGTDIRRITPDDGAFYDFPNWAMGGSKIVYSRRDGGPGEPENLWLADPDGTDAVQLTHSPWRNHQPQVNAAGTHVLFSGFVPGTRLVALYELDLATLLVRNLSAVHSTSVAADADARFAPDGSIVFARSRSDDGEAKTQVWSMAADGTGRRQLTADDFYDLDPDVSPDGSAVAFASYRGPGTPQEETAPAFAKHRDFHIAVRDLTSGDERTLTGGADCLERGPDDPCDPAEASAYVPNWSPAGSSIGFVAPLSGDEVCICVIGADGSGARTLLSEPGLHISWFDWVVPTAPPGGGVLEPGLDVPPGRMLVTGTTTILEDTPGAPSVPFVATSGEDWWQRIDVPVPLTTRSARWDRDRERIAIVAATGWDPDDAPAPTPGRRAHLTLAELGVVFNPAVERPEVAALQIFVSTSDGGFRQLTDPWIEDPADGLAEGDARGNLDPDFSPDGRHVVFTNVSAVTAESFILRLDLETGEVTNLTNATSGVLPVDDAQPRYSPDGRTIAFTSGFEGDAGIYTMDAATGRSVRRVSPPGAFDTAPAWSPDGRYLVYSSYRGDPLPLLESLAMPEQVRKIPLDGWYLVKTEVLTGETTVLTSDAASPALAPVWSPDGSEIAFISVTDGFQPDVYVVPATGGDARLVQITGLIQELALDWR